MPGNSSWVPYAAQGVKGFDDTLYGRGYFHRNFFFTSGVHILPMFHVEFSVNSGVPRGAGVWGVQTHPPKFRRPSKIVPNSTQL